MKSKIVVFDCKLLAQLAKMGPTVAALLGAWLFACMAAASYAYAQEPASGGRPFVGNALHGEVLFKHCALCHYADKAQNKIGPTLQNIIGRQAGTQSGYRFSEAMVRDGVQGLYWTSEMLDSFLQKPLKLVPGTRMANIRITNAQDRADLIVYLQKNSDYGG